MRNLLILLYTLLLVGCVTVVMPNPASTPVPPVVIAAVPKCPPFYPPEREQVPKMPDIGDATGNYAQYLESLAEQLATYVRDLRKYLKDEQDAQDDALREHQRSCRSL